MAVKLDRWLWGLPLVALLWAGGTWYAAPRFEADLRSAIQQRPEVAELRRTGARIEVHGRDVAIVSDFPLTPPLQEAASRALRAVPAVRALRLATATPVEMRPFRLTIRRDGAGLSLRGGVPGGEVHARVLEAATALVGPDHVDDKLVPALDPPPAFAEAAAALLKLAGGLRRGQVSLSGRLIGVQGEARDFAGYNAITSALLALPPGYAQGPLDILPPEAKPFAWSASRDDDGLRLAGYVPSEAARAAVRDLVPNLLPGIAVRDEMQTARGLDPSLDFLALARTALTTLGQLSQGEVAYEAGRVSLSGAAAARDLLEALPDRFGRNLPQGAARGAIALRPVPAVPYVFSASRHQGRVILAGFSPDAATRDSVRKLVQDGFPGEALVDDLHLADGVPRDFARVLTFGLEALSGLANGTFAITGQRAELRGRSLYPEAAERTRQRLAGLMPAGWSAQVDIQAEPIEKPLGAGPCGDLLADLLAREPLRFEPNRAEPAARSAGLLDRLAQTASRCGRAAIRVAVRPEPADDKAAAESLAERRAEAVAAALSAKVGEGPSFSGSAEPGPTASDSQRVTLSVKP